MSDRQEVSSYGQGVEGVVDSGMSWPFATAGLATLLFLLYLPALKGLVIQWWEDPNYSHGFLVPLFAGYVLWQESAGWKSTPVLPNDFGLVVMVGAVLLLIVGTLGAELFTTRLSLVVMIGGIVLFLAGWKMVRALLFPIAFLVFMIPLPAL